MRVRGIPVTRNYAGTTMSPGVIGVWHGATLHELLEDPVNLVINKLIAQKGQKVHLA